MKLSIIIPVYNTSPYLRECLDSIFKQDYRTCEVICVNDGSTDNSLDILNEYKRLYSVNMIVLSQSNQGQSVARNSALDIATGDYILFLDSDDYYYADAITTVLGFIDKYPSADLFYLDWAITSEGERVFILKNETPIQMSLQSYYDYEYKQFASVPAGCVWGGVYNRRFLEENHLRMKAGVRYEDELFVFQAFLQKGNCVAVHIKHPFYHYRTCREGSTTYSYSLAHFKNRRDVIHSMYDVMKKANQCTVARNNTIFRLCEENIIQAYLFGFARRIRSFFKWKDLTIMWRCKLSNRDRRLVLLCFLSPKLMAAYRTDALPSFCRRFINRFL